MLSVYHNSLAIEVKISNGFRIICPEHIIYIKAIKKFSILNLNNNETIISYHLIGDFEKRLPESSFFRCHKSYVINMKYVLKIINICC